MHSAVQLLKVIVIVYDVNSLSGLTEHKITRSIFLADFIPGGVEDR